MNTDAHRLHSIEKHRQTHIQYIHVQSITLEFHKRLYHSNTRMHSWCNPCHLPHVHNTLLTLEHSKCTWVDWDLLTCSIRLRDSLEKNPTSLPYPLFSDSDRSKGLSSVSRSGYLSVMLYKCFSKLGNSFRTKWTLFILTHICIKKKVGRLINHYSELLKETYTGHTYVSLYVNAHKIKLQRN